jgi:N-acetylmuramoyl-L-alanine amidase
VLLHRPIAVCTLAVLLLASAIAGQTPGPAAISVLSREGRKTLPTTELQGRSMVALDDLAALFQLGVREDAAARAVTVTYKNQTIVLTPDQSLASMSGRLISLPAPLTRQGRRWLVPVEFLARALPLIYDARLDFRPISRLLVVGDLRVPRLSARYETIGNSLRVTLDTTPKTAATVSQDQSRIVVKFDADALDAVLPSPPAQGFLGGIHVIDPVTVQLDTGPRFASYRSTAPVSTGVSAELTIDLVGAATADSSSSSGTAAPATPPAAAAGLPVFDTVRVPIKTVVLDPGHGGSDAGVKGPGGTIEKDLVLSVARRVKSAIEGRLGIRVLLTRDGDANADHDSRAAIANNNKADLFISLHANGSLRPETRGATIYYLSLDRFGEDARRRSQMDREVVPVYGGSTREFALVDWELAQAAHVQDSTAFAGLLEQRLNSGGTTPVLSVQKAAMRGLAGANMPAVLFEMGYLTNSDEEKKLSSVDFQNGVAQALTDAVISFRSYLESERTGEGAR